MTGSRVSIGVDAAAGSRTSHLLVALRIAEAHPQQEAVELRLGSGKVPSYSIGFCVASTMNGAASVGHAVDRDLLLLHRFEQRRLRLGRGAVDLVGQHDLGDDRPGAELELAAALVVDRHAGDVAGQQVGRELDALEGAADASAPATLASIVLPTPGTSSISRWPWPPARRWSTRLGGLADDDLLDVGLECL